MVVPWTPVDFIKAFVIMSDFIFADKGFYFTKTMKNEKIDKAIEVTNTVMNMPLFMRLGNLLRIKLDVYL